MEAVRSSLRGIALALSFAALAAFAQPVADLPAADAKKPAVKKSEPKKVDAKKPDAKKPDAKKPDAKKTAAPVKPPAAPKAAAQPAQAPKVYTTGPTTLRDKDGNVIPTSPDAYNVDSALPRKK